jgi:hypothetical protein
MTNRLLVSKSVGVLAALTIYGCSTSPTAPSALPGPSSAIGPASSGLTSGNGATPAFVDGGRPGALGVVYVSGQGLYYDTFVTVQQLPMKGRFQPLQNGVTEFGPGDPGYLGGRWWVDVNANGVQDEGDDYLLCPLLPPGRSTP